MIRHKGVVHSSRKYCL